MQQETSKAGHSRNLIYVQPGGTAVSNWQRRVGVRSRSDAIKESWQEHLLTGNEGRLNSS